MASPADTAAAVAAKARAAKIAADQAQVAAARRASEAVARRLAAGGTSTDPFGALDGANRDVAVYLNELFKSYGIDTLAPQILKMIQEGFSSDTISIQLQQTKEYKQRFAANDARIKAGLPALSPAEYISTERSYRQVMSEAGLPVGFYDSNDDFRKFLEMDVSPTEVKSRVDTAKEAINQAPPDTLAYAKQFYQIGDLVAYALDPTKAAPLVERRIKAAEAAALAAQNGNNLSQVNAEVIGGTGASLSDIQQGVGFISQEQKTTDKLSQIYGGDNVTQDDLVREVFQGNSEAATKRKKLASQERATFGGSSAQGKSSLTQGTGNI
jgi:hypothetical protein